MPPLAFPVALPLQAPKQVTSVGITVNVTAGGCVIITVLTKVQFTKSVTVYVYGPAHNVDATDVDETAGGDQA